VLTDTEQDLLVAARSGDHRSYDLLISPHRAELYAHCYRMLGSAADAEDAVQEALVSAWRGLKGFEGRSPLRAWLYRIATNACLKAIQRRPRRLLPVDYGPAADPHDSLDSRLVDAVWVQPTPTADLPLEQRETVGLAFVAALQHLPARQRAALLLSEVLGYSAGETADLLGTTPTSVYSSLQRARKTVQQKLSGRSRSDGAVELGDPPTRRIAEGYVEAWERGDVQRLVRLLTDDATLSMPPIPNWLEGRAAIAEFLALHPMADQLHWRVLATEANGQLAFAHYLLGPPAGTYAAHSITVVGIRDGRIAEIDAFLFPDLFPLFDLAPQIIEAIK
jgi:RNA polymerase sigma-70 factor, ECF subfamily